MFQRTIWGMLSVFLAVHSATAGPALLFDASNGKVIYSEDADTPWYPASLTKIMTAYLTFEALKTGKLKPEQKIPVSEAAHLQAPSKIGLPVGAELSVELALKALIIKSANDAAVMLAEAIGGTEEAFIARMNATAKRLGMTRTRFVNPNGLPAPEQVTTARDLARLSRAAIRDFPEYAALWSMSDMLIGRRRLRSHNGLLRTYEGADGLKTGFICDSGFNVVASASREGRRLIAVVLGEYTSRDRSLRAASLLEHGFQSYGWKLLFSSTTIESLPLEARSDVPHSIRTSVVSWGCGGPKPARITAARGKRKVKRRAKSTVRSAKSAPKAAAKTKAATAAAPQAK